MDFSLDDSDLSKMNNWFGSMTRSIDGTVEQGIRASALEVAKRLVNRTPVDTGRARGGWTVYMDEEGIPVEVGGNDAAVKQGQEDSRVEKNLDGPGEKFVELINGVPYIVMLEHGHSDQAPAGMVRITIRELAAGDDLTDEMMARLENQIIDADREAGF